MVSTMLTRIDVHVRPHKRRNWIFTHVGLSVRAHNIVPEIKVHEWMLSGIEELLLFFDSCSTNSKCFGARLTHTCR